MKSQLCRVLCLALSCTMLPSGSVSQEQGNPKEAKEVLNTYVTVVSTIYPPAGGVFSAMLKALEFTGYFGNQPDPVAAALSAINNRLDEHERQIKQLTTGLEQLRKGYLGERNWNRFTKLRDSRNSLQAIAGSLAKKPADEAVKSLLVGQARAEAAKFLDIEMWMWSDQSLKEQTWTNRNEQRRTFAAGEMLDADFKAMPTLEYYTTALVVWMATIEHASGGDATAIQTEDREQLQEHITWLTERRDWNELRDEPQSVPEHVKDRIRGDYEPDKYPRQRVCHIWEYVRDDMRRTVQLADQPLTYPTQTDNELCNVPASRLNSAPQIERDREREYGLEVMASLATLLTSLKDKGTVRGSVTSSSKPSTPSPTTAEPFTGRHSAVFENTVPFNVSVTGDFNILYGVNQDGILVWHRHVINSSGNTLNHSWNPVQNIGHGWVGGMKDVLPAGQSAIYALKENGELSRYWHSGAFDGSYKWGDGPQTVGTGWTIFSQLVPTDSGVVYGISPDGILRWNRNPHYADSGGSPNLWANSVNVGRGWTGFDKVFSGGKGVIYVVNSDGKLMWYKHKAYLNPVPMPGDNATDAQQLAWQNSWEGPKEVGRGWTGFAKLFSPGEGHIYGIKPNGDLMWYRHTGWEVGSFRWDSRAGVKIASGWDAYVFAFARIVGSDDGGILVK